MSKWMMHRREFLTATGGAIALTTTGCKALERGYPERYSVEKPPVPGCEGWERGEERFIRSACLQCPGGCGIVVRVVEGRAVSIRANPDYPTNQGSLCPKGLNGLQVLYDPDRIRGPLKRVGARGEGKWAQISWDEATSMVAGNLRELRATGKSQTVAVLGGRYRGHMRDLFRRFLAAYGSPNEISNESLCAVGTEVAHYLSQGVRDRLGYDWEKTRYVLVFGAGFIESLLPVARMLRVFGHLRQGIPGERIKIVQIEPRYGVSAARADEWVQVRPGMDGILALGFAHVIIRDGLYDKNFIDDHTMGFEGWTDASGKRHIGFKDLVLERYSPREVARIASVPEETIERVAHEFATHRPAVAISGRCAAAHTNGLYNCLAIDALNALVGSIDAPGGVLVQRYPSFAPWPAPELDEIAMRGGGQPRIDLATDDAPPFAESQINKLAARLERGAPYPLNAIFFYYTNPLFSAPAVERLYSVLMKVPLLVSFSPFMDDTTNVADLVLPDHTYLERWQLDVPPASIGYPVFSVRQPVVEPLHNTRSTGEALIQIARAIGGSVGRSFPSNELDMIKHMVRGVQEGGRGSIQEADFDEYWKKLLATGGWWDGPYSFGEWKLVLATPSNRYEFYCTRLDEKLKAIAHERWPEQSDEAARDALLAQLGVNARGDEVCLPHYEPVRLGVIDAAFPFVLTSYKTMTHAEGRGGNQPHLQEMFSVQFDLCWEPWVEIHPEDAASLGVANGDLVWLSSSLGRIKVKVLLHDGTCRGVINMPFEYGHTAYGRWAAMRGQNINRVFGTDEDRLVGAVARFDIRVSISKA